jgi:16S rRNA C1402 (ribose-2'-O) methylase RsmI
MASNSFSPSTDYRILRSTHRIQRTLLMFAMFLRDRLILRQELTKLHQELLAGTCLNIIGQLTKFVRVHCGIGPDSSLTSLRVVRRSGHL